MSISVIVITKNEEAAIGRCLESVKWASEIVVLDSGSTDRTVEICRRYTAKVHVSEDWPGFGPQKNRALDLATSDWVLCLDADEWVSDKLRDEIQRAVASPGNEVAFRIPRLSSFCGRYIRHSGWWPDRVIRLFKRGHARFTDLLVHENMNVSGTIGALREPLMHESFTDLEDVLDKMDRYSTASAKMLHAQGKRAGLRSAVLRGLWAFIRTYFLRAGFLDGRHGFMLAVSSAEGTYYRYAKLRMLWATEAGSSKK
ncbi:MAG: glycosyltransferase family 2 protein [Betaproteobacteria bacterium]|nr:glycosyltransferase family 2 protein [Betaproteobacteria bacterium]